MLIFAERGGNWFTATIPRDRERAEGELLSLVPVDHSRLFTTWSEPCLNGKGGSFGTHQISPGPLFLTSTIARVCLGGKHKTPPEESSISYLMYIPKCMSTKHYLEHLIDFFPASQAGQITPGPY